MAGDRTAAYACSAERSDRRPTEYKRRRQNGAPAAPQRHARAAASRGTNRPSSWENFPGYSSLILPSLHFAYTRIAPLQATSYGWLGCTTLYQAVSGLVARASRLAAVFSVAAVSKYTVIQGATATALHYTVVQCTACYRTVLLCTTMLCSAVLCTVKSRPCKKAELSS